MKYENVGTWPYHSDIELVQLSDGHIYALDGWNGETFEGCWRCVGEYNLDASKEKYRIRPVHEWHDEDSCEIIDYEILY